MGGFERRLGKRKRQSRTLNEARLEGWYPMVKDYDGVGVTK